MQVSFFGPMPYSKDGKMNMWSSRGSTVFKGTFHVLVSKQRNVDSRHMVEVETRKGSVLPDGSTYDLPRTVSSGDFYMGETRSPGLQDSENGTRESPGTSIGDTVMTRSNRELCKKQGNFDQR